MIFEYEIFTSDVNEFKAVLIADNFLYLYCCTVHLVDSIIITKPTNALIVYLLSLHILLNHMAALVFSNFSLVFL